MSRLGTGIFSDCLGASSDSDNTWDVSLDDGEQDSNSEGADESDETNDILDDFDGGEIELMFTKNYGEYYTFV